MMVSLIKELNTVIGNFGTARENYDACEEAVKELIRQISI